MLTWNKTHSPTPAPVILIISEQNDVHAKWQKLLQQKGFTVIHECHEYAFQTCIIIAPTLIVIDTHLDHVERLVLCSKLRAISSEPILLLVPDSNYKHVVDIYNAGVSECLLKPVSPAFLVVKIMSWLLRRYWFEYGDNLPPVPKILW